MYVSANVCACVASMRMPLVARGTVQQPINTNPAWVAVLGIAESKLDPLTFSLAHG